MNHQHDSNGGNVPTILNKFFHRKKWRQLDTDVNTESLQHNMDLIPDAARALHDMVQSHSEPKPNAVANALAAVSVTPSFGGGSSSVAGPSAAATTRTKAKKKAVVTVSTDLDDYRTNHSDGER